MHRLQQVRDGVPRQGDRNRGDGFDPDDSAHPKHPVRFEIDYSRCIFCGLCVEACPEDAIRMVKEVPNLPVLDRSNMWISLDELLTWNPQSDVAKPYPPAPRSEVKRGAG
jgi:NADH-quinone oxidoreductase subunit I